MTTEQKNVLRKIIYAVETGGQVYGQQDYSDFTEAYTNSSDEHAITIGAGQWYAEEAQTLLKRIHDSDTAQWNRLDNIGLWEQVQEADWSCFNISRNSQLANLIVQLISSKIGVKCQDNLMDEQLATYAIESQNLGVLDASGQAMCVNFRHQGGLSAVKRILAKTKKPYTLDNLYAACQTDTGNQVGVYESRQKFVYNALKKYFPEEEQEMANVEKGAFKAVELAESREGKNQYTQSDLRSQVFNGYSDCSSLWWKSFEKAYGIQIGTWTGEQVEKGTQVAYYGGKDHLTEADYKKLQVGDLIYFGTGEARHVEGFVGWKNGVPMLFGHGSGTPSFKNGLTYTHSAKFYQTRRFYTEQKASDTSSSTTDATTKKKNTVAYVARMKKDSKCYTESNTKSPSKLFPKLKKGAVVDVMKYTETDSSGLKWYFVRIPYPNDDGFVFEFVPKGVFTRISEISK